MSLTISDALKGLNCRFTAGYLDDITLGDTVDTLGVEVKHFQTDIAKLGLTLNKSKCKIICLAEKSQQWNSFGYSFQEPTIIGLSEEARPDWILSGFKFLKPKTVKTVRGTSFYQRLSICTQPPLQGNIINI